MRRTWRFFEEFVTELDHWRHIPGGINGQLPLAPEGLRLRGDEGVVVELAPA